MSETLKTVFPTKEEQVSFAIELNGIKSNWTGNLDESFSMSSDCEESGIDADVFHDFSLKINILTIKKALKLRFKPEQIARLGNMHVIYPSLSKKTYLFQDSI